MATKSPYLSLTTLHCLRSNNIGFDYFDATSNLVFAKSEDSAQYPGLPASHQKISDNTPLNVVKGQVGENLVFDILMDKELPFVDVSNWPNLGDFHIHLPRARAILVEVKNWSSRVDKKHVEKFFSNVETNRHIIGGILISLTSNASKCGLKSVRANQIDYYKMYTKPCVILDNALESMTDCRAKILDKAIASLPLLHQKTN